MRYSRVRARSIVKDTYTVDMVFVLLVVAAIFVNVLTLTTLQTEQGFLYNVSILEMMLGLGGLVLVGLLFGIGKLQFSISNWNETQRWMTWGAIGFIAARFAAAFLTQSATSTEIIYNNLTIVITSAIFEEALFVSMALLIYMAMNTSMMATMRPIFGDEFARFLAIITTALMTAVMFAAIHIGVYGTDMDIMLALTVARFIYTIVFLYSRNFMSSTFAHLVHNISVWFVLFG